MVSEDLLRLARLRCSVFIPLPAPRGCRLVFLLSPARRTRGRTETRRSASRPAVRDTRPRRGSKCRDLIGKQMGRATGYTHIECGANPVSALRSNGTAVEFYQFLHQREANTGPFGGPRLHPVHAVKSLE